MIRMRLAASVLCFASALTSASADPPCTVYGVDSSHPWNRLHAALWEETTELGYDRLDGFVSGHALEPPDSERRTAQVAAIAAFRTSFAAAPSMEREPLRRAILCRDLWAVLDRIDVAAEPALKRQLAALLHDLALTPDEIAALPDNLADAVAVKVDALPSGLADLTDSGGGFVVLDDSSTFDPLALQHDALVNSRSTFVVLLRLPEGRIATVDYLARLRKTTPPLIAARFTMDRAPAWNLSPDFPQFPVGTEVALVRRALLVDDRGRVAPTSLTESVQIRRFLDVKKTFQEGGMVGDLSGIQDVAEFELSRQDLLAGRNGGLHRLTPEEQTFGLFPSHSNSRVRASLMTCGGCHAQAGIYSVNSFTGVMSGPGTVPSRPVASVRALFPATLAHAEARSVTAKEGRASFGELRALWQ